MLDCANSRAAFATAILRAASRPGVLICPGRQEGDSGRLELLSAPLVASVRWALSCHASGEGSADAVRPVREGVAARSALRNTSTGVSARSWHVSSGMKGWGGCTQTCARALLCSKRRPGWPRGCARRWVAARSAEAVPFAPRHRVGCCVTFAADVGDLCERRYPTVVRRLQEEVECEVQHVAVRAAARQDVWHGQCVANEDDAPLGREVIGEGEGVKACCEQFKGGDVKPLSMEWRQREVPKRALAVPPHAGGFRVGCGVRVYGHHLPRCPHVVDDVVGAERGGE
eukprot:4943867-Pleurochrysis_carterae.AAC.1